MTNRRIVIPGVIGLILLILLLILLLSRGQTNVSPEATPTASATPTDAPASTSVSTQTPSSLPPAPTELVSTPLSTPASATGDQGLLAAPVGLAAEPGNTVIRLTWQPVSGAVGYVVFRDEAETPLNAVALTETNYLDMGLTNQRTYLYTVAAVNALGEVGALSSSISVIPGR